MDTCGREVGPAKNGKPRTISLPRRLRDMLAEHLTQPAPAQARSTRLFDTASSEAVYHTVFIRRVFGAAEAALPAEKKG